MKFGSTVSRSLFLVLLAVVMMRACAPNSEGLLFGDPLDFSDVGSPLRNMAEWVAIVLEGAGIGVILLGAIIATGHFIYKTARESFTMHRYHRYREQLGEVILLGLEFLVAADIVGTVAVSLNMENVLSLAAIILVRTFLSFTLEVETTGYWPWQRGGQSRVGVRERVRQSDSEAMTERSEQEEPFRS